MQTDTIFQALIALQKEWELDHTQMAALTHVDLPTYEKWVKQAQEHFVPEESIPQGMENAVCLISIHRALSRKLGDLEACLKWLFTQNQDFGGNKPIDIAASSAENLKWLAYYVNSFQLPES